MADSETELPKSVVKRLVKAHLDKLSQAEDDKKNYQLNGEALLAFCEGAKYFISFLTAAANDICKEKKRQTISADDIFNALEDLDMSQFIAPLKEALQGYKIEQKEKSAKKATDAKKRKHDGEGGAEQGAEGAEDAGAEASTKVQKTEEGDAPADDAAADDDEENEEDAEQ